MRLYWVAHQYAEAGEYSAAIESLEQTSGVLIGPWMVCGVDIPM